MASQDLISELDAAAAKILERANNGTKEDPISLGEMVRAFESIAKWADLRNRLKPPKKAGGEKFDRLRKKLNGKSVSPGTSSETEEDAGADSAN